MEMRKHASYTVNGENVFVIGGWTPQQSSLATVKKFLVRERRWRDQAPLSIPRCTHAATAVRAGGEKTLIGVFGGYNGTHLPSCEVYDVSWDR
ncbi:unnamed protein product [Dibothriocephalus latus]|uniref:Kelch repeat protein n=1 Tax=Dibothriocephalus latus TaxID=60516 RepID=A0A3P6NVS3_DIBLA|nr:unnamed protein product [Dibothriocephalus latus]